MDSLVDMRYKPSHLPQLSAPFSYMVNGLKKEGVGYKVVSIHPNLLKPSQGIVDLTKISTIDPNNIKPIWVSDDLAILDGHHRYGAAINNDKPIKCVVVKAGAKDAARVLNKIQDIYDYERQQKVEEVVAQDQINAMNEPDTGVSTSEFLATLENENKEAYKPKKKKITGYRKQPINEKSSVGNFFSMKECDGYKKYDMEFDNILDTNDVGIVFKKTESPVFILAKHWFPNIDFESIAKRHNVSPDVIINRAVAERAKNLGFDGIKYGDIMIQGF